MFKKKIVMTFPPQLSEIPLTYHLVKDYDLAINILKAKITPGEEGKLILEISSQESPEKIEAGIEFLRSYQIQIESASKEIVLDDAECIHCGACTAVCSSGALHMAAPDWKLTFDKEQCIVCEMCVKACPMRIIAVSF